MLKILGIPFLILGDGPKALNFTERLYSENSYVVLLHMTAVSEREFSREYFLPNLVVSIAKV